MFINEGSANPDHVPSPARRVKSSRHPLALRTPRLNMYGFGLSANIAFRFCTYKNPMLARILLKTIALTGGNIGPKGSVVRYFSGRPLRCSPKGLAYRTVASGYKGGPLSYRGRADVSLSSLFPTGVAPYAHAHAKIRQYRFRILSPALPYRQFSRFNHTTGQLPP